MKGKVKAVIEYREIDGYHIFTSNDIYGLYVAAKDFADAVEYLGPSIKMLMEANRVWQ